MVADEALGTHRVVVRDGPGGIGPVGGGAFTVLRRVVQGVVVGTEAALQGVHNPFVDGVGGHARHGKVQVPVQKADAVGVRVLLPQAGLEFFGHGHQGGLVLVRAPGDGQQGQGLVHALPEFHQGQRFHMVLLEKQGQGFADVDHADLAYVGAALDAFADVQEPLLLEGPQGFTDDAAPGTELLLHFALAGQTLLGRKASGKNGGLDLQGDVLAGATGLCRKEKRDW